MELDKDLALVHGCHASANAELVRRYLDWQRDRNRRPSSLYDMAAKLGALLRWVGDRPLAEVSTDELERWVKRPRRSHKGRADGEVVGSPATRAKEITILRSLFAFLRGRDLVPSDPAVALIAPQIHNVAPKPVPTDTWVSVWSDSRLSTEARVVLGLGFFAGLRRAEIVSLAPWQWSDGKVRAVRRKGGGTDHTVPVRAMLDVFTKRMPHLLGRDGVDSLLVPLDKLATQRGGAARLLPWTERDGVACRHNRRKHELGSDDIDPERVNVYLKRWLVELGKPADLFTCHMLRHSTATYLLQCGVPLHLVAKLLNHSNITTTMRYVKAGGDELTEWAQSQADWFKPFEPSDYGRHG